MNRREFFKLIGGAAAWPVVARAQQGKKTYRIGVLETTPIALNAALFDALKNGLRSLGYIEGENLILEYRSADGRAGRFPDLARELLRLQVDLIVTRGTPAAIAAKAASETVPIVSAATGQPLEVGLATSLGRPGGNFTGLSSITNDIESKQIELISELVPGLNRIALLYNMGNPIFPLTWQEVQKLAPTRGIQPQLLDVRSARDLRPAFDTARANGAGALLVGMDGFTQANRQEIIEQAREHHLPAVYPAREFVDTGGLMSYGVSYSDLYRRAAIYIDKIFRGANPGELPIEQPTKFDLIINVKAAKELALEIPATLLATADELID